MKTNSAEKLLAAGIRPSPQRVAVYESISARRDHPSAEMLFRELRQRIPTMSRTTVLDAMRLFQSANLIRDVRCEEGELRFDGRPEFHAHFKCRKCGCLVDIPVEDAHSKPFIPVPDKFAIDDEQLIYYGLCDKCSLEKGNEK